MGEGTELLEAARAGELERVKALVEQDTNADKDNALRWAAREGSLDVIQYLVEHGAVVNAKDYLGDTALMRAAEGGHTTVVQFLTDGCKADVKASNKNGYTALVWAARCGQDEVVRYLAERRGVEVDARDKNGYTALMKVCKGGNIKVLRALAAAGADVNGSDDFGYTALMIASGCGHIDIVRFLVEECHVVVNSRNNRGKTAVRVASDCGNGDVERYLTPFLLHSPPSYVSAATSTAENDVLETQTMSIPPSEVEPIDFSTSSSIGPNYHRVKWLEADACVKLLRPDSDHSSLEKEQLQAIWNALGETTDLAREREARWERFGWPRAEILISGVSNTCCFIGKVKNQEELSKLLAELKAEIDQSFKYTPDELGLLKKAFEDLSSTDEHETLSNLTPQWFIPWYEVLIDERNPLGVGGFGSVYRAKWLDSDVVVKSVIFAGSNHPMLSSSLLSYSLSATEDPVNVTRRAEALAMFRGEVDLWFDFNHPHVVRLFGACHVGTPFF
ncbi:hypothetical protein PF006_g17638, partial [Phytophthora fragariae]